MEASNETLGALLERVNAQPKDHDARLAAARQALLLCFRRGDPHFADVVESLLADVPRLFPRAKRVELDKLAAQAGATRRAVAMAHRNSHADPYSLGRSLGADPDLLATEVAQRLADDQPGIARVLLEVALARHPHHDELRALQRRFQDRWPCGFAPCPEE